MALAVNLSVDAGWTHQGTHWPARVSCESGRCREDRCFDQRLNPSELCGERACCGCAFCRTGPAGRWTSPTGQVVETLTTATDPPFVFAYNPLDMDMLFIRQRRVVEPILSRLWRNRTLECCRGGGQVVDVGGNFGWYTLLALALGCSVVAFEPVGDYRDVIRLGVHLNTGFADRVALYANVVFDQPGRYALMVPRAGVARSMARPKAGRSARARAQRSGQRPERPTLSTHMRTHLGMASMIGPRGVGAVKDVRSLGSAGTTTYTLNGSRAVRLDDVLLAGARGGSPLAPPASISLGVCMLKVDVEGLEPQVMRTADELLSSRHVAAVQIELTRRRVQWCANVRMLRDLLLYGFNLRKVRHLAPRWDRPRGANDRTMLEAASDDDHLALPLVPPGASQLQGLMQASRGRAVPSKRAVSHASDAAVQIYEHQLTEFSSNLLGQRPRTLVPRWNLANLPLLLPRCARADEH